MPDANLGNLVYNIVANDLTKAGTATAKGNFAEMGLAAGAAMTAIGAGMTVFIDKGTQFDGTMQAMSVQTGISQQKLGDMALSLTNARDGIEEVTGVMKSLSNAGVDNADDMKKDSEAVLALAEANNTSGDSLFNKLIPAFKLYGLTVNDVADKSDALTEITHSTQYSITDVGNIMDMTGVKAMNLGLSFDQVATVVEVLGQKGVPARQAIADINQAAGQSSNIDDFYKKLGITNDQLDAAKQKLDGATGSTEEYDNIALQHAGIVANLSHTWDVYSTKIGQTLEPLSGVVTVFDVLGPVLTTVSAGMTLLNTLTGAHAAAATADAAATMGEAGAMTAADTAGVGLLATLSALAGPLAATIALAGAGLAAEKALNDYAASHGVPGQVVQNNLAMGASSGYAGGTIGASISNALTGAIVSKIGGSSGKDTNGLYMGNLHGRASGGPVSAGTPYIVGEAGPELFVPGQSGSIIPNSGSTPVEVHVYIDSTKIIKALAPGMGNIRRITTGAR